MTPDNCYLCQLAQIPGLSIDSAQVIARQYPSMASLVRAYLGCTTDDECRDLLSHLMLSTRRLGQVLSSRVYQYIMNPVDEGKKIKIKLKLK